MLFTPVDLHGVRFELSVSESCTICDHTVFTLSSNLGHVRTMFLCGERELCELIDSLSRNLRGLLEDGKLLNRISEIIER